MAYPEQVDQGQEKAQDDQPLEPAAVLAADAAPVEVHGEQNPGGKGHPDLGVARRQVLAGSPEHPDEAHAQTQGEDGKAGTGKAVGGAGRGVECRQVVVESPLLEEAGLDQEDDGGAAGQGKAHQADQGEGHVHPQPGVPQQDGLGFLKADRHQHRVEQPEESQRGQQQAQMAHAGIPLEQQGDDEQGDDEQGNHHEHAG